MPMHNLTNSVVTKRVSNAVAAGTGATDFGGTDTQGFDGIRCIVIPGVIAASGVGTLKAQYSNDDGSTDAYADVAGTSTANDADTDDNKLLILDIHKPKKRWVKFIYTKATGNVTIDAALVELYRPTAVPVTQDSTVEKTTILSTPALGTP